MLKKSIYALALFLSVYYTHSMYTEQDNEWDILVFTQHWPVTVCKKWSRHGRHTCTMPKDQDAWTIHGIWPTMSGTKGPNLCNSTWKFDMTEVKSIQTQLEQGWINIFNGTAPDDLWSHEWIKHGTCAVLLESLNSELKYFTKGLDLLKDFTMTNILSQGDVLPSDDKEYEVADFYTPIKKKLGTEPKISCKTLNGTQYIYELQICFNMDFKITDCIAVNSTETVYENTDYITNCNSTLPIIYPRNV